MAAKSMPTNCATMNVNTAIGHGCLPQWVPKGTPKDIIRKLTSAATDALGDPALRPRLENLGQVIPPREQQRAEALGEYSKENDHAKPRNPQRRRAEARALE